MGRTLEILYREKIGATAMAVKDYIKLMRPHQWYKNLLVFVAIVFVESPEPLHWPWTQIPAVFDITKYPPLIIGFLVFCAISSAGYIMNDIFDIDKDAAHPEKMDRPLPSGRASKDVAVVLAILLYAIGFVVSLYILGSGFFLLAIILYIINSQLYSWKLRNWAIVDVCIIAVGFIIRAVAGTFLIRDSEGNPIPFTSWLIIGIFFVALVLAFGKRKNELQLLGDEAPLHKPVFKQYTESMLDQGITMSGTWVVLFYALYCYNQFGTRMATQPVMLTVPIAAGIVMRYIYLIQSGSPVGRKPHLAIKDKGILIGGILFVLSLFVTLFFWEPIISTLDTIFESILTP